MLRCEVEEMGLDEFLVERRSGTGVDACGEGAVTKGKLH